MIQLLLFVLPPGYIHPEIPSRHPVPPHLLQMPFVNLLAHHNVAEAGLVRPRTLPSPMLNMMSWRAPPRHYMTPPPPAYRFPPPRLPFPETGSHRYLLGGLASTNITTVEDLRFPWHTPVFPVEVPPRPPRVQSSNNRFIEAILSSATHEEAYDSNIILVHKEAEVEPLDLSNPDNIQALLRLLDNSFPANSGEIRISRNLFNDSM